MNTKIIGLIIGIVLLGGLMVTSFMNDGATTTGNATSTPAVQTENNATTSAPTGITATEVTQHNSRASCWSIVRGKVYDLTTWINQHPGGADRILSICGKDGTSAFEGQHAGQSNPENTLVSFYIGALIQ